MAFIACVTGVLGTVAPVSQFVHTVATSGLNRLGPTVLPLIAWVVFGTGTMQVFYLALYLNESPLRISNHLRRVALIAALGSASLTALRLPGWFATFQTSGTSVFSPAQAPLHFPDISPAVALLSNVAYILLLVTVFCQSDKPAPVVPTAKFLRVTTDVTVTAWGIWVAFNLVRFLALPFTYSLTQTYALQLGRTPPPLFDLIADVGRTLVSQTCMLALPYIVWRSIRLRPATTPILVR